MDSLEKMLLDAVHQAAWVEEGSGEGIVVM